VSGAENESPRKIQKQPFHQAVTNALRFGFATCGETVGSTIFFYSELLSRNSNHRENRSIPPGRGRIFA
jgi:hypothetical protein